MNVYSVVVYQTDAESTEQGTTPVEIPVVRYAVTAITPQDAIMQVSAQLEQEEAS